MVFSLLFFPIGIIVFVLFIILFLFIFWIWALISCLVSDLKPADKILWFIVILFFCIIGALLYFIFAGRSNMVKTKKKGKKLLRSNNRMIAGVCSGIGEYFDIDPTLVRLIWVAVVIFTGFFPGIIAYVVAWIIIPEK
ncbi:PspC domain-containing protein [Candidatus Woesearchaeota archaeon]|nr:PspC domain-containing protein [Candidatus Woesearchaeota archaeon]